MSKTSFICISLYLLLGFIGTSCLRDSFQQRIPLPSSTSQLTDKIDSIAIDNMNSYNIPGLAVGVVSGNTFSYAKGYGVRSIQSQNPISKNTIFHAASISKLFTALAILKLYEEDKITLDQKLISLIPDLQTEDPRVAQITIRQLLNHTSGLPDIHNYHWENQHQDSKSLEMYVLGLSLSLQTEPGVAFEYSNLGYDILGYVVEKVSGESFEDYVKDRILLPNQMIQSDFRYFLIEDSLRVSPHTQNRLTGSISERKVYPYTREHAPSSTLNTSAEELSSWMQGFMNRLDSSTYYTHMLQPSTDVFPRIGLGFQLYDFQSQKAVGHFGGDKGFRSFLMMIPEKKIGVVVLGNCDYEEDFRQEVVYPIAELLLDNY